MALRRPEFEEVLPLLATTYAQGRLVPFLGWYERREAYTLG
jgi:hypothetical protein